MARIKTIAVMLFVVSLLVGCGGSSGTALGHTQSCRSSTWRGSCEGRYKKVTGRITYEIKELAFRNGTPVNVDVELAVRSGALRVELVGPGGEVNSAVATPGQPLALSGVTLVDAFGTAPVVLQVVDGEAVEGVTYAIVWAVQ
jgi:hypothetical protein